MAIIIPPRGPVSSGGSGLVLGTVTTSSATVCQVQIDGATTATVAVVPQNQQNALLRGSSSVGARVIGTRIGSRFYVTDVISGGLGGDTDWIAMTFASGNWANYTNEEPCAYRRINGVVYWKGIVHKIAGGGINDAWTFVPGGFRPADNASNDHYQTSIWMGLSIGIMYIRSDGAMFSPNTNPSDYVLLSDIRPYPADA